MSLFFFLYNIRECNACFFYVEGVSDEDFYELDSFTILHILPNDLTLVHDFLTKYNAEKSAHIEKQTHPNTSSETSIEREKETQDILESDVLNQEDIFATVQETVDSEIAKVKKKSSVETSYHKNLPGYFII